MTEDPCHASAEANMDSTNPVPEIKMSQDSGNDWMRGLSTPANGGTMEPLRVAEEAEYDDIMLL